MNKKVAEFFNKITKNYKSKKRAFIVVCHVIPNSVDFLEVLAKHGRIAGIVAKPNSVDNKTYENLTDKGFSFIDINKEELKKTNIIKDKIAPLLKDDEQTTIFDMGGYFATTLSQLNLLNNISGIVEDTENGHQKYEEALTNADNNIPILSIARSRAKEFEDYLIGRVIAKTTVDVLENKGVDLSGKKIGVIGFGEVGRGAVLHLNDKYDVRVYDKNPRVKKQISKNFALATREDVISESDVIIGATGNKSLTEADLYNLKEGCYISSCTSCDDEFEFDCNNLPEGINLLNNGNAINFMDTQQNCEMLHPYIYLTQSALIFGAVAIEKNDIKNTNKIFTLSKKQEKKLITTFRKNLNAKRKEANTLFVEEKIGLKR